MAYGEDDSGYGNHYEIEDAGSRYLRKFGEGGFLMPSGDSSFPINPLEKAYHNLHIVGISRQDADSGLKGWTIPGTGRMGLDRSLDQEETFEVFVHEMLHNRNPGDSEYENRRNTRLELRKWGVSTRFH